MEEKKTVTEIFNDNLKKLEDEWIKKNSKSFIAEVLGQIIEPNIEYLPLAILRPKGSLKDSGASWLMHLAGQTKDNYFFCVVHKEEQFESLITKVIFVKSLISMSSENLLEADIVLGFNEEEIKAILEYLEQRFLLKEKSSKILIPPGFYIWRYKEIDYGWGEKPINKDHISTFKAKDFEEALDKFLDSLTYSFCSCYYGFEYYTAIGGWIKFSAKDIRNFYDTPIETEGEEDDFRQDKTCRRTKKT